MGKLNNPKSLSKKETKWFKQKPKSANKVIYAWGRWN